NKKVKYGWMRGTHTFSSVVARFLSLFSRFEGADNPYYNIRIPEKMRRGWQILEFISALPVILFKFVIPSLLGYWVIGDRYIPDLIAWISLTTKDETFLKKFEARILLALSHKAEYRIHITAHPRKLTKRRKMREEEIEANLSLREMMIYDEIETKINAQRIDTSCESVGRSLEKLLKFIK
ncbi:hypothetical protein AKJ47_03095, partial [candidate division MSBL1 archaeon SCGC-AAA261G05]